MLCDVDVEVEEDAALSHLLEYMQNEARPSGSKADRSVARVGWHAPTSACDLLAQVPCQRRTPRAIAEHHRAHLAEREGEEPIAVRRERGPELLRLRLQGQAGIVRTTFRVEGHHDKLAPGTVPRLVLRTSSSQVLQLSSLRSLRVVHGTTSSQQGQVLRL